MHDDAAANVDDIDWWRRRRRRRVYLVLLLLIITTAEASRAVSASSAGWPRCRSLRGWQVAAAAAAAASCPSICSCVSSRTTADHNDINWRCRRRRTKVVVSDAATKSNSWWGAVWELDGCRAASRRCAVQRSNTAIISVNDDCSYVDLVDASLLQTDTSRWTRLSLWSSSSSSSYNWKQRAACNWRDGLQPQCWRPRRPRTQPTDRKRIEGRWTASSQRYQATAARSVYHFVSYIHACMLQLRWCLALIRQKLPLPCRVCPACVCSHVPCCLRYDMIFNRTLSICHTLKNTGYNNCKVSFVGSMLW